MRSTSVKVLPVPGPATTASALAGDSTARRCSSLRPRSRGATSAFWAALRALTEADLGFSGAAAMSNIAI